MDNGDAVMSEGVTETRAGSGRMSAMAAGIGAIAVFSGVAGVALLNAGSRLGIEGGIMLLVVALGLAAVALGGRPFGPAEEGPLDLSARLGLGLLGGALAGLAHGVLTEAAGGSGLTLLLGVGIDVELSAAQYLMRALSGSAWGLGLAVLYPLIPGNGFAEKGATYSLLPSLYTLFVVYPVFLGLGLLGVRQGFLTFPLVLIGNAVAGLIAAWVISWGASTDLAPVSDPLIE